MAAEGSKRVEMIGLGEYITATFAESVGSKISSNANTIPGVGRSFTLKVFWALSQGQVIATFYLPCSYFACPGHAGRP